MIFQGLNRILITYFQNGNQVSFISSAWTLPIATYKFHTQSTKQSRESHLSDGLHLTRNPDRFVGRLFQCTVAVGPATSPRHSPAPAPPPVKAPWPIPPIAPRQHRHPGRRPRRISLSHGNVQVLYQQGEFLRRSIMPRCSSFDPSLAYPMSIYVERPGPRNRTRKRGSRSAPPTVTPVPPQRSPPRQRQQRIPGQRPAPPPELRRQHHPLPPRRRGAAPRRCRPGTRGAAAQATSRMTTR
jgi:hypothetical protein